jgi:hypothetical protein
MNNELLTISEAAKIIGVSIETLRRWDKSGHFPSIRKTPGGDRYYLKKDVEIYLCDLFGLAKQWAFDKTGIEPREFFYCQTSFIFQARLTKMENELKNISELQAIFSLIVAVAGEIGNNSFDHNIGNWPDVPGIFFGYDVNKKYIVLADRGQGIFTTLKRVKPELSNDQDAMRVAFTEIISGRAPEARGNGLKFVRQVIANNPMSLFCQTGNAELNIEKNNSNLNIKQGDAYLRGCIALIKF